MRLKIFPAVACGMFLAALSVLSSCKPTRISAVSCPELPDNRWQSSALRHRTSTHQTAVAFQGATSEKYNSFKTRRGRIENHTIKTQTSNIKPAGDNVQSIYLTDRSSYISGLTASLDKRLIPAGSSIPYPGITEGSPSVEVIQNGGCDTIILRSGARITGKVEEINQVEIRYRRCDNLTGPIISISKYDVATILYINGTRESILTDAPPVERVHVQPAGVPPSPKTEGLGLAGFIAGIVGLFVAGIPLGSIGIIFGGISLARFKKEPGRYKGRGFAIWSIVLGVIDIIGSLLAISAL